MNQKRVLIEGIAPLHSHATYSNVAAASAAAAFGVFPCRNDYCGVLALSGMAFSFDAYRWHDYAQWGFGANEFLAEHWQNLTRATGVRIALSPYLREGSATTQYRQQITQNIDAGRPFIGNALGACPFAVGVGYVQNGDEFEILWNTRFVGFGVQLEEDGLYRAGGTVVALLDGFAPVNLTPEEELLHSLRCCGAGRSAIDLGWGELAYGAVAVERAAEDLANFTSSNTEIMERFQIYSVNHLIKYHDYRTQAVKYLMEAMPQLGAKLQAVAGTLIEIYTRQLTEITSRFKPIITIHTVTELGEKHLLFQNNWLQYRHTLRDLYHTLAIDEHRAEAVIAEHIRIK